MGNQKKASADQLSERANSKQGIHGLAKKKKTQNLKLQSRARLFLAHLSRSTFGDVLKIVFLGKTKKAFF